MNVSKTLLEALDLEKQRLALEKQVYALFKKSGADPHSLRNTLDVLIDLEDGDAELSKGFSAEALEKLYMDCGGRFVEN